MAEEKLCIVNVGAHAFDLIKGAGGTLIKYAQAGHRVVPVVISDCFNRGELPPSTTREEAAEIQREEVRKVSRLVGFDEPVFLHWTELDLVNNADDYAVQIKIADELRRVKPDVVFAHWPGDQSGGFYNHGNAGILATKAYKIAALEDYKSDLPPHETKLLMYYLSSDFSRAHYSWNPSVFVDVTDQTELVNHAYQTYITHTLVDDGTVPDYLHEYRLQKNRMWGLISGCLYADAFALPQFIGSQYAFEWLPDPWVAGGNRGKRRSLSIPSSWPKSFAAPVIPN